MGVTYSARVFLPVMRYVKKKKNKTCYDWQVGTHEGFLTYLEATIGYWKYSLKEYMHLSLFHSRCSLCFFFTLTRALNKRNPKQEKMTKSSGRELQHVMTEMVLTMLHFSIT